MCDVFIYFSVDLEGMDLQDAAATGKLDAIGKSSDDIPQGKVDNNLGPDRLTDPKALDPIFFRQLTL